MNWFCSSYLYINTKTVLIDSILFDFFWPFEGCPVTRFSFASLLCLVTPLIQYNMTIVTMPYSFWPAIFFKFGFLGQSNGQLDSSSLGRCYLGSTEELPILQIVSRLCLRDVVNLSPLFALSNAYLMLVNEIQRTIPLVRNTNNDPRISGASCEGMLHASLVQFNIICVNETLLKGLNWGRTIEQGGSECYPKTSESANGKNRHMNVPAQVAQAQYVSVIISTYIVKRTLILIKYTERKW